jgi:ADP-heptose:LPS heptosyltransferase
VQTVGFSTTDDRLSLRVPDEARERIRRRLTQLPIDLRRPWIVIHPGASASSRRYPPLNFALAARELIKAHGWQVVFSGTADERALVQSIQAMLRAPSHSLAGELDIADLAALLELAPLLIVNNTGPAHIAAAVGTPLVDLYALTNPQHTPWRANSRVLSHHVPCQNCFKSVCPEGHHNCLRLIPPTDVVAAALDLFDGARPKLNGLAAAASPSARCREYPTELRCQPKAEVEWWVESEALAT